MTALRIRLLITIAVLVLSLIVIFPPGDRIRLGLDLQGGVRLVLRVHTDEAVQRVTAAAAADLRGTLTGTTAVVHVDAARPAELIVRGAGDAAALRTAAAGLAGTFDGTPIADGVVFRLKPDVVHRIREDTMQQARTIVARRVDALGVAEPLVTRHRTRDRLDIQLPGVTDVDQARQIIQSTARLRLMLVEHGPFSGAAAATRAFGGTLPVGLELLPYTPVAGAPQPAYYLVQTSLSISGGDLRSARQARDELNRPVVAFTLSADAAGRFGELTGAHIGRLLATVLDDHITSLATIQSRIDDQGRITGLTRDEVLEQVITLNAGALPASMEYVEERTVGPTLGADAVQAGMTASVAGFVLVLLFMGAHYRLAGAIAALSVLLNIIVLLALLVAVGAAMTLPGVAAFVLTIGMGVDSNVLVFERIREELAGGQGTRAAVTAGFRRVWRTIVDTHVTSLLAAAFLFQFGTGPVSGFATVLALGLLANAFTAVFVSRTLFELVLSHRRIAPRLLSTARRTPCP